MRSQPPTLASLGAWRALFWEFFVRRKPTSIRPTYSKDKRKVCAAVFALAPCGKSKLYLVRLGAPYKIFLLFITQDGSLISSPSIHLALRGQLEPACLLFGRQRRAPPPEV